MPDELPPPLEGKPIVNPPVVTKPPPPGRKFPCEQCGARLDFDPANRQLRCSYCHHIQAIEKGAAGNELDLQSYLRKRPKVQTLIAGRSSEVRCPGCGAVVLLEDKVVTENCPFCRSHLDHAPEAAKEMIDPESILPFAVPYRDAIHKFDSWLRSLWFAPSGLTKLAYLGQLSGVYVPYWTFDAMTYSWYTGERGDNYTVQVEYTERDAQGNYVVRTRNETKIRWSRVAGEIDHFFDDVLIRATKSLPEHLLAAINDWKLSHLEGFRPEFLAGFLTERYAVPLEEANAEARAFMEGYVHELCRQNIGGDHQRVHQVETHYVGTTFKHILLPIWIAAYRYQDKLYQILINGQTGQVVGERPWSWWKILRLVLLIALSLGAVVALIRTVVK